MKITKSQLKQIIKEELSKIMEADPGVEVLAAIGDIPKVAEDIANRARMELEAQAERSGLDPALLAQAVAAILTAD
jgi:hypothetical protein